jgi:hypothetical protein
LCPPRRKREVRIAQWAVALAARENRRKPMSDDKVTKNVDHLTVEDLKQPSGGALSEKELSEAVVAYLMGFSRAPNQSKLSNKTTRARFIHILK